MKTQNIEQHSLAWEICSEMKAIARRWKIAFFAMTAIEILTVVAVMLIIK